MPCEGLTKAGTLLYFARKHDCDACALKPKCCPNMPARKIGRFIHEAARDKARAIAKTAAYAVSRKSPRVLGIDAASSHILGMAARDQWSVPLICQKCGKTGEANFSENDYPFMRKTDFRVDSVSEGFEVRKYGDTSSTTEIVCSDCKELAK